ncbi:MAG: ActD-like protein [Kofleriaceae bacterium]
MTSLPDWLVERVALDEVAPAHRDRVDRADAGELAERVTALREDSAAELARHPAGPAVDQIVVRAAAATKQRSARRRRHIAMIGLATSAAAVLVVARFATRAPESKAPVVATGSSEEEITRAKGSTRLLAFRQIGNQVERLDQDAIVRSGDLIQLRYNAGGERHGVIASVDGAGLVTLHYPASEDAATTMPKETTTLPHAYALDDAPRFERFFFLTADEPIDITRSLDTLRAFARRSDCATAALELPAGLHQWSLRLRKPSTPSSP